MSIKNAILLFLSFSLSLTAYAVTPDEEEKHTKGGDMTLKFLVSKRKKEENPDRYTPEFKDNLPENSKKRKINDTFSTNHALAYSGIIESLIDTFVKGENTEVSIKGLHNLLRTSKSFCTSKNLRYVINLEKDGLCAPSFIPYRIKSLNETFKRIGFPSVENIFKKNSPSIISTAFNELVKEWGGVGLKLIRQSIILPALNHNELVNIINNPKNPMQRRAISCFLARKHTTSLTDIQENVRIVEPIILEKLNSNLLEVRDLANILRVTHYSENIKNQARKILEDNKEFYKTAPLESLLEGCMILNSKQQKIKSLSTIISTRLENRDHTLSTKELIKHAFKQNFPSQLIKPLVRSIWESIHTSQDTKDLIEVAYENIPSDFNQKFLKSLWQFKFGEVIIPHLSNMDLNSLDKFSKILESQKNNIQDYKKIEPLVKEAMKNK